MGGTCCRSRKDGQISKSLVFLPFWVVNGITECIRLAEQKLGRPVTLIEIHALALDMNKLPVKDIFQLAAVMMSLFREDLLLTDKIFEFWTLEPKEGFMNYTDFWHKHFDGYTVDSEQRIRAVTAKTINLNNLVNMLKSKDRSVYEETKWMFDGHARFLDGQKIESNKIGFLSYPRSGNSFLRKTVESTVGIPTGGCISLHTSTSLQIMGLKGEYITDDTTWIVKSHHPYKMPLSLAFDVNKVICIVRNPLDVIISYACLANTMNHSTKPKFNFHEEYAEWWNDWVRLNATSMKRFFDMIFEEVRSKKYDVHFCRYEDLVNKKQETIEGIVQFLAEIEDMEGTNAQERAREVAEAGLAASQSYQLKKSTGKFNASEYMYTEEQKQFLHEQLVEFNHYFGYTKAPEGEESYSEFFTYDEEVKVQSSYNEFRKANEESLNQLFAKVRIAKKYTMNHDSNTFDMMDGFLERLTEPTLTHAAKEMKIGEFAE